MKVILGSLIAVLTLWGLWYFITRKPQPSGSTKSPVGDAPPQNGGSDEVLLASFINPPPYTDPFTAPGGGSASGGGTANKPPVNASSPTSPTSTNTTVSKADKMGGTGANGGNGSTTSPTQNNGKPTLAQWIQAFKKQSTLNPLFQSQKYVARNFDKVKRETRYYIIDDHHFCYITLDSHGGAAYLAYRTEAYTGIDGNYALPTAWAADYLVYDDAPCTILGTQPT